MCRVIVKPIIEQDCFWISGTLEDMETSVQDQDLAQKMEGDSYSSQATTRDLDIDGSD
jgi:hypothetical protein